MRRGRGGKGKEWTNCVQSDIRSFGITGRAYVVKNIPSSFGACRCAFVTSDPFDLTCQGLVLVDASLSRGGTVGVNHTKVSGRATVFRSRSLQASCLNICVWQMFLVSCEERDGEKRSDHEWVALPSFYL